jgi:hypothetical protein
VYRAWDCELVSPASYADRKWQGSLERVRKCTYATECGGCLATWTTIGSILSGNGRRTMEIKSCIHISSVGPLLLSVPPIGLSNLQIISMLNLSGQFLIWIVIENYMYVNSQRVFQDGNESAALLNIFLSRSTASRTRVPRQLNPSEHNCY